jgi:SAM-dependent methyltransferase
MVNGESDRQRWDRKYAAGKGPAHFAPKPFLSEHRKMLTGGRALDLGCGFGGNALYLASLGYQVDAVDVSGVAVAQAAAEAKRRRLQVQFVQADLGRWWVRQSHYDLITVFYYLNRGLMPEMAGGMRPNGLLFQLNHNRGFLEVRPGFNPDYLLEPGELLHLALDAGLEVLYYSDGPPGAEHSSQLIARRGL